MTGIDPAGVTETTTLSSAHPSSCQACRLVPVAVNCSEDAEWGNVKLKWYVLSPKQVVP